jgi:hypothetical protein
MIKKFQTNNRGRGMEDNERNDETESRAKNITSKSAVFWAMAPWVFIINRRFGGTCRLHLQGRGNNANEEKCQTVAN